MPPAKQVHDYRIGDILLYKNEESRMITDINHKGKAHLIRTTNLAGENPRLNASDEVKVQGTQEVLF